MSMETMVDRQIEAVEDLKSTVWIVISETQSHAAYLGRSMQAYAHASLDTRPALELLDLLKKTASKAMELRVQASADAAFYRQYKEQHTDQQEDDTEDEEE